MPTVGFLVAGAPSSHGPLVAALVQRLGELGWIEGRTIIIEYRWAEGSRERAAEIAAELARLKVDLIATSGIPSTGAAKQATTSIPIVFAVVSDPVGAGLVSSLARPEGNLTGLSLQYTAEVQATLRSLRLEVVAPDIRRSQDLAPALDSLNGRVEALYVVTDPLMNTNRDQISALALAARLPTMQGARELVEAGGLMSYGPSLPDLYRRAADYVDKIGGQSQDRPGARARHPADPPRPRRRGDRMRRRRSSRPSHARRHGRLPLARNSRCGASPSSRV